MFIFQQSNLAKKTFEKIQKNLGIEITLILEKPVDTRWNSHYIMLERCIRLKQALTLFVAEFETDDPPDQDDWELANQLRDTLKPLYDVTVELSAEKSVTISKIIPLTGQLLEFYNVGEDFDLISAEVNDKFRYYINKSIEDRLGKKVENDCTFAMATFLDPRFKNLGFFGGPQKAEEAKKMVKKEAKEMFANDTHNESENEEKIPTLEKPKAFSIWDSFNKKKNSSKVVQKPNILKIDKEVNRYLELEMIGVEEDPLEWWKITGKEECPTLFEVALKLFIIPASSVPSERIFSILGNIVTKKRTRLGKEITNQIVYLNRNMSEDSLL